MKNELKIAIFIPTYNASRTLPILLDRIPNEIKNNVKEIFIIDDASQDNTYLIGIGYKELSNMQNLQIYKNKINKGYGGNQKFAYQYAINKGFDIIVMLHGDAQYAPEMIPKLLKPFEDEQDIALVFGSRMRGNPLKGGMPLYKYIGNIILTYIENKFLDMNLSEYHSGYRIYNCHALKQIPFNKCSDDFHFDSEILIQLKIKNLKIRECSIPTYYGKEKSHVNVIAYGINILKSLLEYKLHQKGIMKYEKFNVN